MRDGSVGRRIRFWLAILAGVAAVIVLFGWICGFAPLDYEICEQDQSGTEECARYYLIFGLWWQLAKFFEWTADTFVALGTIAIACFTATLWRSTHRLWEAARQQSADMRESIGVAQKTADAAKDSATAAIEANKINRDALVASQRAWVYVKTIKVSKPPHIDSGRLLLPLDIELSNSGAGPATHVHVQVNLMDEMTDETPTGRQGQIEPSNDRRIGAALFPGQAITVPTYGIMRPDDTARVMSRGQPIWPWVIGVIFYHTPVDTEWHKTGFIYNVFVKDGAGESGYFLPISDLAIHPERIELRHSTQGASAT